MSAPTEAPPPSWVEAERVSGRRLDRRRTYTIVDGVVFVDVRWRGSCSSCDGYGCTRCRNSGMRWHVDGVPVDPNP